MYTRVYTLATMHSFFVFVLCVCKKRVKGEGDESSQLRREENFYAPFLLTDRLSSEVVLGNLFLALLYPFSMTDNGISTNICETEVFFKFILPQIPKDIYSLKEISIFKEGSTDRVEPVTDDRSDAIDLAQKH